MNLSPLDLTEALAEFLAPKLAQPMLSPASLASVHEISRCRSVTDTAAALELVHAAEKSQKILKSMLELLARVARRHINSIATLPPAATVAARCLEHLVAHSLQLTETFSKDLEILRNAAATKLHSWETRESLALASLDEHSSLGPDTAAAFQRAARQLSQDLDLIRASGLILVDVYAEQLGTLPSWHGWPTAGPSTPNPWVSLAHTEHRLEALHKAPQALQDLRRALAPSTSYGHPHLADLIQGKTSDYAAGLARQAEALATHIEATERFDRLWFAGVPLGSNWRFENTLMILALSKRLRHEGESSDDIDAFARSLMDHANKHEVAIQSLLESEVQEFGPRIAPVSMRRALRHIKFDDPDCALSVSHRHRITQALAQGEAAARALMPAPSPSMPSAPGVGSVNRSP
jgi:hypothetical protein